MASIYLNEKIAEGGFGLVFRVARTEQAVCGDMECRTRECVAKVMERKYAEQELNKLIHVRDKILDPEMRKSVVIDASMCEIDVVENYHGNPSITKEFGDPVIIVFENAGIDLFTYITSEDYSIPVNRTTLMQMEQFLYFLIILLFKYHMIHADIKCENIVYSHEKGYRLIDWGLATDLDTISTRMKSFKRNTVNADNLFYNLPIAYLYHNLSQGLIGRTGDPQEDYFTRKDIDILIGQVEPYFSNFQENMENEIAKANRYFNGQHTQELQLQIMLKYDVFAMGIVLIEQVSYWYFNLDSNSIIRKQLLLFIDYLLDRCVIGDVRKMDMFPELYLAYTSILLHPVVIDEIELTEEDIDHIISRRNEIKQNDPNFNLYLANFRKRNISGIWWNDDVLLPALDGASTEELEIVDSESHFSAIQEHAETDDISHGGGGTDKSNVHFPNRRMMKFYKKK